ncbi:hypothetical protein H0H87_010232 [Tephrocybe sp. NHM501043]|nr:hypothetical protein H0H87_010232 [Tephrocybe sp. NHM501043]
MPLTTKDDVVGYLPNTLVVLVSTVAIVVLGDIGRSPRMMYHAQSFAENGFLTYIVGYGGSKPIPSLERQNKVQIRHLPEPPKSLGSLLPFIIYGPIKVLLQVLSILHVLLVQVVHPPEFILVQNPPTIPTLAVVWFVEKITGSKVIIDWHNLGYSILAMKLGNSHPFVKVATWFEAKFGRTAYAHLFVTTAMRDYLVQKWGLRGRQLVLHDRPPHRFHRSSPQEIHDLFVRLKPSLTLQSSLRGFLPESSAPYSTPFTHTASEHHPAVASTSPVSGSEARRNSIEYRAKIGTSSVPPVSATSPLYKELQLPTRRPDRPALVVSSTSWTPDEDFEILLEAMQMYEIRAGELASLHGKAGNARKEQNEVGALPKLLVIITGKGPLREKYMKEVAELQEKWKWVRCVSLWLEAEDYPILLGSADLGVSLHSSSSALDLPMKVVDMFGCGLPVCALNFACLHELVKDGLNGRTFESSSQLAQQFEDLLTDFPKTPRLDDLRASLSLSSRRHSAPPNVHTPRQPASPRSEEWKWGTWEENWNLTVKPLILSDFDH